MSSGDKELEQQLMEAGKRLLDPPPSVEELLPLLDKVENFLSNVEQTPSKSMKNAVSPSLDALVGDKLFRHPDVDVKVAVASCISEITRITAPDAPYSDEQMKEVFKLMVSSFENLPDKSSRSYAKRVSMLETVAKVRSCVVMLDLECDALIIEMFQHFLKAIRDYHPENVFTSMETIMTLVVEESEDISAELLSPLLASLRKDDEEVLPVAQKLAVNVIQSCGAKLKPYLIQAVKSSGISLDDYCNVVGSICHETSGALEQNEVTADEHSEEERDATEAAKPKQADMPEDRSQEAVVNNGVMQTGKDEPLAESSMKKKLDHDDVVGQPMDIDKQSNGEPDVQVAEKKVDKEHEDKQTADNEGSEFAAVKEVESPNVLPVDGDKGGKAPLESKEDEKDTPVSPRQDQPVELAVSAVDGKEGGAKGSTSKPAQDGSAKVSSPTQTESLPDETQSRVARHRKKKARSTKEVKLSVSDVSEKASAEANDAEVKNVATEDGSKKGISIESDSEEKPLKQLGKKVHAKGDTSEKSSKQKKYNKKQSHGKVAEKDASKVPMKDEGENEDKVTVSSPKSTTKLSKNENGSEKAAKSNSKRKHTLGAEKTSHAEMLGKNLVGSKIKVWWPMDRAFYEGVVDSYDSAKKRHLVLYDDGDQEILNLKTERWEFVEGDSKLQEEEAVIPTSPDASSEMPKTKKAKTSAGQSSKQGKISASAKSGAGASGRSKAAAARSGKKSKDKEGAEIKEKDSSKARSGKKSKDEEGSESEEEDSSKLRSGKKSKDEEGAEIKEKDSSKARSGKKAKDEEGAESKEKDSSKARSVKKAKDEERAEGKEKDSSKARSGKKAKDEEGAEGKEKDSSKARSGKKAKDEGGAESTEKESSKAKSGKKSKDEEGAESKEKDSSKARSGKKSKDGEGAESREKDSSKAVSESEEETLDEDEEKGTKVGGKSIDAAPKSARKTKKVENVKSSNKSKQETLKSSKQKQESSKPSSGTKGKQPPTSAKATEKPKSGSSKAKEKEEKDPAIAAKALEKSKGKSPGSSKTKASDASSAKKRKR